MRGSFIKKGGCVCGIRRLKATGMTDFVMYGVEIWTPISPSGGWVCGYRVLGSESVYVLFGIKEGYVLQMRVSL